jgi:glycosyltransferase involved in cell wall biosynthesis
VANDLDTLLANYLAAKIKGSKLVHDSHEYFTGVPELEGRNFAKKTWKKIERWIFPQLNYIYTVNDSIAALYEKEYKVKVKVVRNFPVWRKENNEKMFRKTRKQLGLPEDKKIILYQGSVNVDRGLLEAVDAMQYVTAEALLLIIGDGDILPMVKKKASASFLKGKVLFIPRVPFEDLRNYTAHAHIGLSLDKDTNLNYRYSLPNKIFDYIHAGVPVLASNLVEIKKIFSTYDVGIIIENHSPHHIAEKINYMLTDTERLKTWKKKCIEASSKLNWQEEEKVLQEIYSRWSNRSAGNGNIS